MIFKIKLYRIKWIKTKVIINNSIKILNNKNNLKIIKI